MGTYVSVDTVTYFFAGEFYIQKVLVRATKQIILKSKQQPIPLEKVKAIEVN